MMRNLNSVGSSSTMASCYVTATIWTDVFGQFIGPKQRSVFSGHVVLHLHWRRIVNGVTRASKLSRLFSFRALACYCYEDGDPNLALQYMQESKLGSTEDLHMKAGEETGEPCPWVTIELLCHAKMQSWDTVRSLLETHKKDCPRLAMVSPSSVNVVKLKQIIAREILSVINLQEITQDVREVLLFAITLLKMAAAESQCMVRSSARNLSA
eukprot:TRINITY_DN12445_c0_g1_i1.p1 TRINITY_DN12445_c0_g1~~TRINITY_DN12445_c0_g1_i1.p1  ORF type:complete len:211 (+),score=18.80 TRINITY_DN12445_c0_g1_i1:1191-1823(+)